MKHPTIYHNPRCSKSRQALQILEDKGLKPRVIEYIKSPLSKGTLSQLLRTLHMKPRDVMRKKETLYQSLKLDNEKLTDDALLDILVSHPILLERPIVIWGEKAIIARPPELLFDFLNA